MECKTILKLPGGIYRVVNVKNKTCFYCDKPINGTAISEKVGGYPVRYYHVSCFKNVLGYKISIVETPGGLCISV